MLCIYRGHNRRELVRMMRGIGYRGLHRYKTTQLWKMYYAWIYRNRPGLNK